MARGTAGGCINQAFIGVRGEPANLRPVPTLSEPAAPKRTAIVRPTNVVHYRQNRYAVPKGTYTPGRRARIETDEAKGTVAFYDFESGELLAIHDIHYGVGKGVGLPRNAERFKETKYEALKVTVLQCFEDTPGAVAYIERVMLLVRHKWRFVIKSITGRDWIVGMI